MTEEMGFQMQTANRYWWCRRDVLRQSVPQSGSGDRKSSIADGWKTGDELVSRWLLELLSE